MAKRVEPIDGDPVVVVIEDEPPASFGEWVKTLEHDEPVEMGTSAAELLADARSAGEA